MNTKRRTRGAKPDDGRPPTVTGPTPPTGSGHFSDRLLGRPF